MQTDAPIEEQDQNVVGSHVNAFAKLIGPSHVISKPEDLAPYLNEARGLYAVKAFSVLRPSCTQEVAALTAYCNQHGIGVVALGGNTGLVGGTAAAAGQVLLSLDRMKRIRQLDSVNATITIDSGCVLQAVQEAADQAGLCLPLSIAAEGSAQVGGVLATNAGGINVLRYGSARDFCLGVEAVTADGRVLDGLGGLRKDNTGYDLKNLLIGSEGTLAIITGAVLRLHPRHRTRCTAFIGLGSTARALDLYSLMRSAFGEQISAFEFISGPAFDMLACHSEGQAAPLSETHAAYVLSDIASVNDDPDLQGRVEACLATALEGEIIENATIAATDSQRARLWNLRERLPEAQKHAHADIKHDIAVPVSSLANFIAEAEQAVTTALPGVVCAPFGHFGDGNLHFNFAPPPGMDLAAFRAKAPMIHEIVIGICMSYGGSFAAEHGVGRAKRDDMVRYKDPVALEMMRAIKAALDPRGILNPGAVL